MIDVLRPWLLLLLPPVLAVVLLAGRTDQVARTRRARRGSVVRKKGLLVLRSTVCCLLVLASAGPRIRAASDKVAALFVLDVSDSVGSSGVAEGLEKIERLRQGMRRDDESGLVTVARRGVLDVPPRPGPAPFRPAASHDGSHTDLAEGIYTAIPALGTDGERRIVLVSDGRSGSGDLDAAVHYARDSGVTVDTIAIGRPREEDVIVEELRLPFRIPEGEVHEISVLIDAGGSSAARLVILRNGDYIGEDRRPLAEGLQRRTYSVPAADAGTVVYEVIIEAAADSVRENSRGIAAAVVEGDSGVLWIGNGRSPVIEALELQGVRTRTAAPGDMPDTLQALSAWDTVILDNVSSRDLSLVSLDLLEAWVRAGGGLMMIGGDASFGLGAYQGTAIERALPVDMDAPSSLYIPSLTMVMVIDKSGSMGGGLADGTTKLEVVKEAVLGAVEVLNPLYTFGLLAFDADYEWTIPPTDAGNFEMIRTGLAGLESGGGTVLYPAVREAYERLAQSPSAIRHLVILSDGLAEPGDYTDLARSIARDGISVSTVAVGEDADIERMKLLAETGGGRYWFAEDASEVPRIFASESMIVSRGLVVEETVFPLPAAPAEALAGIDLEEIPPLHGYIITYAKPTAVEALLSPRGHPLLAYGRHGLGRTAAFTSDLRGGWGRDWTGWSGYPRLLAQTVRWLRRSPGSAETRLELREDSGDLVLVLEARRENGGYRSDLSPLATVRGPDQREVGVPMTQTAPGRYEGRLTPWSDGVYQASAADERAGIGARAFWSRPYSPELAVTGADRAVLADAARAGGGRFLDDLQAPEDWWRARTPQRRTLADLTLPLAFAALLLFLTDIALRDTVVLRRPRRHRRGEVPDVEELIVRGLEEERHRPGHRRPTPAEAARILAQRRAERDRAQT